MTFLTAVKFSHIFKEKKIFVKHQIFIVKSAEMQANVYFYDALRSIIPLDLQISITGSIPSSRVRNLHLFILALNDYSS